MNSNRGIFESFPGGTDKPADSPFTPAEPAHSASSSPFATAPSESSPFAKVGEAAGPYKQPEPGKPAKLPERRKPDSPFSMAEPSEGFGFDAPAGGPSPFTPAEPVAKPAASPSFAAQSPAPAPSPFPQWGQPTPPAQASPLASSGAARPQEAAPAASSTDYVSDSSSIRQLELRAIFGVDRELSAEEILQRARSLPGIRGIVRVGQTETAALESLKNLVPMLGLAGPLKLYAGNSFVEFVREGSVLLAVQTDRGFAPGVRETLMIVARELGKLA
ncbi:MAG TPA: hypothetical protein VLO11_03285 [Luteolibacter sp.]|nr:hypothetical protein [Luteolibacter sp.]